MSKHSKMSRAHKVFSGSVAAEEKLGGSARSLNGTYTNERVALEEKREEFEMTSGESFEA